MGKKMEQQSFELIQPLPKLFISMTLDKSLELSLPVSSTIKWKLYNLPIFVMEDMYIPKFLWKILPHFPKVFLPPAPTTER